MIKKILEFFSWKASYPRDYFFDVINEKIACYYKVRFVFIYKYIPLEYNNKIILFSNKEDAVNYLIKKIYKIDGNKF